VKCWKKRWLHKNTLHHILANRCSITQITGAITVRVRFAEDIRYSWRFAWRFQRLLHRIGSFQAFVRITFPFRSSRFLTTGLQTSYRKARTSYNAPLWYRWGFDNFDRSGQRRRTRSAGWGFAPGLRLKKLSKVVFSIVLFRFYDNV